MRHLRGFKKARHSDGDRPLITGIDLRLQVARFLNLATIHFRFRDRTASALSSLFVSQRFYRIETGCLDRWPEPREKSHQREGREGHEKCLGIDPQVDVSLLAFIFEQLAEEWN